MNNIADELDPVWDKIKEQHDAIAARARRWIEVREELLPFCKDMVLLGADVSVDSMDINFRLSGDKDKFLKLVRLHRRHGFRPTIPEKGETEATWRVNKDQVSFWIHFASTVCRRVQVGTKTQEVPVYETQCDTFVPTQQEIEASDYSTPSLLAADLF
jgi:hypothetical protein